MLFTDDVEVATKVRKWSTQSREKADWYQHKDIGYNYRMSNVIAGVVRGQLPYLEEHIAKNYVDGLKAEDVNNVDLTSGATGAAGFIKELVLAAYADCSGGAK